jgi:P-type E1-E2 ATPase
METVLLSGDSIVVTKSIADAVMMRQHFGELLPKDKIDKIETLKKSGTTIMVGDGINDAPSLAAADVGITLASATDIAKESAHVTIVGDHLDKIPWMIDYSKKTLSVIRWNLFWAFGYNGIGIVLAAAGLLQPVIAALAMIISSLVIIMNSRRLRE